jgi:tRNA1Val (adenine37-N6)-methyltransferase
LEKEIFRFKQFKIIQNSASVFKVNTEAVLLTAWTEVNNRKTILEVGCGTGLISIGLIQRILNEYFILAIDINPNAVELTNQNIELNELKNITVDKISIQELAKSSQNKFDLIISNPPYFETKSKSIKERNQLAKYTDTLNFSELIASCQYLLTENGIISLIIPFDSAEELTNLASIYGLFLTRRCDIYTSHKKGALRSMLEFRFNESVLEVRSLYIVDIEGIYTDEYKSLVKNYYTIF